MLPSMPVLFSRESQDVFAGHSKAHTLATAKGEVSDNQIRSTNGSKCSEMSCRKRKLDWRQPPAAEKDEDINETVFVSSYFAKVQNRFAATSDEKKFLQFQEFLNTFDPYKETPADLYRKIEVLFGESNADLIEEFLTFLTPGQAAEVGRFMEHFMLTKMLKFIELLQSTFARKPAILRKVIKALLSGLESNDLTEVRRSVGTHLRNSPRLMASALSLLPDERPPDSLYETNIEHLSENILSEEDECCDVWEFKEPTPERPNVKDTVDTAYLNGRVFLQQGRILRPAKILFPNSKQPYRYHARRLTPAHYRLSTPDSEEEHSPRRNIQNKSKAKKPKKNELKSPCAKNIIKDGVNTKKDATKKDSETKKDKEHTLDVAKKDKLIDVIKKEKDTSEVNKKDFDVTKRDKAIDAIKKERDDFIGAKKQEEFSKIGENNHSEIYFVKNPTVLSQGSIAKTLKVDVKKTDIEIKHDEKHSKKDLNHKDSESKSNNEARNKIVKTLSEIAQNELTDKKQKTTDLDEFKTRPLPDTKQVDKKTEMSLVKLEQYVNESDQLQTSESDNKSKDKIDWTRNEDKTILQVLKGETGSEQTFNRIMELLPHRSINEVKERFFHVMNLLQEMALGYNAT